MKKPMIYVGLILAIALVVVGALTYLAPHFDWRLDTVDSDIMEPSINVGSLLVTRQTSPSTIDVGDVIIFRPTTTSNSIVINRVVSIERETPISFVTKGDAQADPNPTSVPARNVLGKAYFSMPYVGRFTGFLNTSFGFTTCFVLPAIILILVLVGVILQRISSQTRPQT